MAVHQGHYNGQADALLLNNGTRLAALLIQVFQLLEIGFFRGSCGLFSLVIAIIVIFASVITVGKKQIAGFIHCLLVEQFERFRVLRAQIVLGGGGFGARSQADGSGDAVLARCHAFVGCASSVYL